MNLIPASSLSLLFSVTVTKVELFSFDKSVISTNVSVPSISFHLKDMYLGEEVSYFCEHCKDDTMFHFVEFAKLLDLEKVREAEENHSH